MPNLDIIKSLTIDEKISLIKYVQTDYMQPRRDWVCTGCGKQFKEAFDDYSDKWWYGLDYGIINHVCEDDNVIHGCAPTEEQLIQHITSFINRLRASRRSSSQMRDSKGRFMSTTEYSFNYQADGDRIYNLIGGGSSSG